MGACAGVSGPQRTNRQNYQSKLRNKTKKGSKMLMNAPKGSDSKTRSNLDLRNSSHLASSNLQASKNTGRSMASHILIRDTSQKQNLMPCASLSQYETLRETDLRKTGNFRESYSRFSRNEGYELERIESMLQRSQGNDPQDFTQMLIESGIDRSMSHSGHPLNTHVISCNNLGRKKRGDLDIIQQLLNEEAKTPQYIRGMRQSHGEDIQDIRIDINGVLPPVTFEELNFYLKDLQSLKKLPIKS